MSDAATPVLQNVGVRGPIPQLSAPSPVRDPDSMTRADEWVALSTAIDPEQARAPAAVELLSRGIRI